MLFCLLAVVSSAFFQHFYIRRFVPEGDSDLMLYMCTSVSVVSVESPACFGRWAYKGWDMMQNKRSCCHYCGLTTDSMEAERADLITIILNVAATMHRILRCIQNIQSIDERMEHELGTNYLCYYLLFTYDA